jgi:hypothetical protein
MRAHRIRIRVYRNQAGENWTQTQIQKSESRRRQQVCMYVRMYVYTYVCMYVCMHVCMYVQDVEKHVFERTQIQACVHIMLK